MLQAQIREDIKTAMRARDALRLEVLRGILTAFTNELVATRRTPQETLEDVGCIAVLKRQVKQRKDASQQFRDGGRPELADKEDKELVMIEAFLPQMMARALVIFLSLHFLTKRFRAKWQMRLKHLASWMV